MSDKEKITADLLSDLLPLVAGRAGTSGVQTPVPRLTVWTSTVVTPPTSAVFEPMFYAVMQGTKLLIMGENRFELKAGACAASSFGLPFLHQFTVATPTQPYIAVSLHLDTELLTDVMLDMPKREDRWSCAVAAGDLDGPLGDAFARLVRLIKTPTDIGVLGAHYESELYYRLLQSSMTDTLRQIGQRNERFQQLKATADWLASNYSEQVDIRDLASDAGMSVTSFHRHFKRVTGFSPLAFQRHIRLLEARKLLAGGAANVSRTAFEVGYVSPSQFTREYKSMFGVPPVADLQR